MPGTCTRLLSPGLVPQRCGPCAASISAVTGTAPVPPRVDRVLPMDWAEYDGADMPAIDPASLGARLAVQGETGWRKRGLRADDR